MCYGLREHHQLEMKRNLPNVGGDYSIQWYKKYEDIELWKYQTFDDLKFTTVSK